MDVERVMSSPGRRQMIPWLLGLALIAFTLVGANRLLQSEGTGQTPPANKPQQAPTPSGGTILLGTIDSEPSPVFVGPPALPSPLTVTKVLVQEGDEVKPLQPLVQFDDSLLKLKLQQAEYELAAAKELEKKATIQEETHKIQLERQQSAVKKSAEDFAEAERIFFIENDKYERVLAIERNVTTNQLLSEAERAQRRRENTELSKGQALVKNLKALADDEVKKLEALRLTPVAADKAAAAAQVAGLNAKVDEAKQAISLCLLRAGIVGGIVEQIIASPAVTFGPASRGPVLVLVPTGPRVVRAEAEAEFAFKIADKIGKSVTIYDGSNFNLTYSGTIRRISTAYLPRRSASEFQLNPPKTLELIIDVTDPAPPGKPPLKVGQPVRVSVP
jgi:multidrug resistance efflux pump